MKITPLQYSFIKHPSPIANNVQIYNSLSPLRSDTVEISFKCNNDEVSEIPIEQPVDFNDYKHINGIHCPSCGTKMLSEDEYAKLIDEAARIDNGDDFKRFLNQNSDFLSPSLRPILSVKDDTTLCNEFHKNSMHAFFQNARRDAFDSHKKSVILAKDCLYKFAFSLDDENARQELLDCISSIKYTDSKSLLKVKLAPIMDKLDLTREQKNELYGSYNSKYTATSQLAQVFKGDFMYKTMSSAEISQELTRRLFAPSLIEVSPISKFDTFKDNENNQLFICKKCNASSGKHSYLTSQPLQQTGLKENTVRYISDIAYLIGRGELPKNFNYISNFLYFTNKVSYDSVKYDEFFKERLGSLMNVASRRKDFEPLVQEEVGVPCASCETILMPHSVKVRFEHDLSMCDNLKDYTAVLRKYEKYIGEHSKDLAKEFFKLAEEMPDASDDIFANELSERMIPYYNENLYSILESFIDVKNFFLDADNPDYAGIVQEALSRLVSYISDGKFDDFDFYKLNEACLTDIMNADTPSVLRGIVTRLRLLSYVSSLSKTDSRNATSDKDKFYTLAYNIIKPSTATVNHLEPLLHGGENDIYNYVGLCKPCNSISKSESSIFHWYQRVFGVRKHMHKQLEVIDKMAKEGKIVGYDDWAKRLADIMFEKTYGRYDIRPRFNKTEE